MLSGDTYDPQESSCVAFNEGFAEFFADKLEQEMNADGLISSSEPSSTTTPMDRAELSQTYGASNLTLVAGSEYGWQQACVLTSSDVTRHLFGTASGSPGLVSTYTGPACSSQPTTLDDLADALYVIGSDTSVSGVSVASFLGRADNRLSAFDSTDSNAVHERHQPGAHLRAAHRPTAAENPPGARSGERYARLGGRVVAAMTAR